MHFRRRPEAPAGALRRGTGGFSGPGAPEQPPPRPDSRRGGLAAALAPNPRKPGEGAPVHAHGTSTGVIPMGLLTAPRLMAVVPI